MPNLWSCLVAVFLFSASAGAKEIRGTVLNRDGKAASGAYVWLDGRRAVVRADARGEFAFPGDASAGRAFAASGNSFVSAAFASGARPILKLEPIRKILEPKLQGRALLDGPHTAKFGRVAAGIVASRDPQRFLTDPEDLLTERGLEAILRTNPPLSEAALGRIDSLHEPFLQCRLANSFAHRLWQRSPQLAKRAFDLSDSLWRFGVVGGNDLQFPWVGLTMRFAPTEAQARWLGAKYWVGRSPDVESARAQLATAVAPFDLARAISLFDDLPLETKNSGLLRLAESLVEENPTSARAILADVSRADVDGASLAGRRRVTLALVERLRDVDPDRVRDLARDSYQAGMLAALARVERPLDKERSDRLFRQAVASDDLSGACRAAGEAYSTEKALGKELLALVRTRVFAALESEKQPVEVLVAFARAIQPVDPAAARYALERGISDCGYYVVPKASLIGWLATIDPSRAMALAGEMENPEWRDAARIVIGAYLERNRLPEPLANT